MSFFTKILENKIGRWALGLSAVFLIGAGAGWYVHPDGDHVEKVGVKYKPLKLRSYAIKFDGKTYYPTEFINRVIHDQGLDKSFKPMYSVLPMFNFENDQFKVYVNEETDAGFLIEKDANKVYRVVQVFSFNEYGYGLDKSFKPMFNFENDQFKLYLNEETGKGFLIEKDANKVYSVFQLYSLNDYFNVDGYGGDAQEMKRGCHRGGGHSHHHIWHGGGCYPGPYYPGPYWNPWGYPGCPGIYGGGGDLNLIIRI